MAQGCDYSWTRPDTGCLRSYGYEFVMRYVALGSLEKLLSTVEANVTIANGLAIVCLAEGEEGRALNGYGQGYQDAIQSNAWAHIVGMPDNRPIYFAVDFDAQSWEFGAIGSYFDGAAAAIGRQNVGVYGSVRTINAMAEGGHASWFFQTYAWSRGAWSPYNHVEQYDNNNQVCGGLVDFDRSMTADFGQWGRTYFPGPGTPDPGSPDTSGLPDVHEDGPWDFAPHIDALSGLFNDMGANLGAYARGVEQLRDY